MDADRESADELAPAAPAVPAWAERLAWLMDDALRVPGTGIGIGLDAILGFFLPGLGDAATAVVSLSLLVIAFQRRVPKIVMLRMMLNVGLDALLGAIPIAGDVLDIFYRANRQNLRLLRRYEGTPRRRADLGDYLFVIGGFALVLTLALLPIAIAILLFHALRHS
jgi:hypothetical protein